uniref:Helitron helicase-like domain-containing protein n=1 Tax=Amphimedon queenslandica TaxID=400682 RepID=A0A1X7V612_AMPQE
MFSSIRGTNQDWFRVKGEVKAMIAENGSPTLFHTLSCAEYDSADIAQYLRCILTICHISCRSGIAAKSGLYVTKSIFCYEAITPITMLK